MRSTGRALTWCGMLLGCWSLGSEASVLMAQGVRYSAAPAVVHFKWNDQFGLKDVTMWGGRVGARFGGLVSLDGYYFRRADVATDLGATGLLGTGGAALVDQSVDLQHYGVDLRVELGAGGWHPFISGGAGVFRFEPGSGPRFDQIVLKYGGGLMMDLAPGISGQLFVENNRFKLDRYRFATPGATPFPVDPDRDKGRDHLSFGAGLGIALGGGRDKTPRDRWSLASIPIEPMVGRLNFDDPTLDHQWFGGARIGLDIGQYFGVRGYYLRGFGDKVDDLSRIQSYGAEAQFNFNRGIGPAPFLLAGVGKLDFMTGFVDPSGKARSDRNLFIVGAGMGFRMSDQLRINLAARDWISSASDFDDISGTGNLQHNLMLSAGLAFALGRGRTAIDRDDDRDRDDRTRPEDTDRDDHRDRDDAWRDRHDRMDHHDQAGRDTVERRRRPATDSSTSNRTVTLPAPTEGEIYVRYGKAVGRTMIKEELRSLGGDSTAAKQPPRADSSRAMDDSVRTARMIREAIMTLDRERGVVPAPVTTPPDSSTGRRPARPMTRMTMREREPAVYAGFNLDRPRQFIIGGLIDMTPGDPNSRFRFLPEVALGFGSGGTSLLLAANIGTTFGNINVGGGTTITPRARVGFGLLTGSGSGPDHKTQGVMNLTYGVSTDLLRISGLGRPRLTIEHQGIDLFDSNRLLFGLTWRR